MLNLIKKREFKTKLFVVASFTALFILFVFYLYSLTNNQQVLEVNKNDYVPDKYYLKDIDNSNPYITNNPRLEDMLTGPIITTRDPIMGDVKAPVAIVYYADFECNYCSKQEQILKKVIENYKYKVKLVWKDFPKREKDSISYKSSIAARCAQEQGKFWPYHDLLYEFSSNLNQDTYDKIAEMTKLDMNKFHACQESEEPIKLIEDNIDEAFALELNGIPFTYVNNQEILGEIDYDSLVKIIEVELNKE